MIFDLVVINILNLQFCTLECRNSHHQKRIKQPQKTRNPHPILSLFHTFVCDEFIKPRHKSSLLVLTHNLNHNKVAQYDTLIGHW